MFAFPAGMRLHSFEYDGLPRLGAEVKGQLVDLQFASRYLIQRNGPFEGSSQPLPGDLLTLLRSGERALKLAHAAEALGSKRLALPVGERLHYTFDEVRLLPPVRHPGKIIVLSGQARAKFSTTLLGPGGLVPKPHGATGLEASASVALTLGQPLRSASAEQALRAVFGWTLALDICQPDMLGAEPLLAHNFDGATPVGPCVVTSDSILGVPTFDVCLELEGKQVSSCDAREVLIRAGEKLARLAEAMTLEIGDLILLPVGRSIPLSPGARVVLRQETIGILECRIGS